MNKYIHSYASYQYRYCTVQYRTVQLYVRTVPVHGYQYSCTVQYSCTGTRMYVRYMDTSTAVRARTVLYMYYGINGQWFIANAPASLYRTIAVRTVLHTYLYCTRVLYCTGLYRTVLYGLYGLYGLY